MPKGRKPCKKCNTQNALRAKICSKCSTEFVKKDEKVQQKKAKKEEKKVDLTIDETVDIKKLVQPDTLVESGVAEVKVTPREHAKRILSNGKDSASHLLYLAKRNHYWNHVDWDYVEANL